MAQPSKSDHGERSGASGRHRKVARVLELFREGIPAGEFDEKDWQSLQVAVRVVYETEELGTLLGRRVTRDRSVAVADWSDSLEGAITFMSWVRELTSIVTGVKYSKGLPVSMLALWRRHRAQAGKLLGTKLTPAKRLSMLVELGGIEVSLWGHTWSLEPMRLRLVKARVPRARAKSRKADKG